MTVRDSSGVRVVESARPVSSSPKLRIVPEPLVRLGWTPDGPQFENVSGGFIRRDGGAVVADAGASMLLAIDAAGDAVRTIGRSGEGPGEFSAIGSLVRLPADSFLVVDDGNHRITFFNDLEYVGDVRFEGFYSPSLYEPFARRRDGAYWMGPKAWVVGLLAQEEPGWVDAPLLLTSDFADVDTVAEFPMLYNPGDANPIQRGALFLSSGERVAFLASDAAQVTWLDGDGLPEQIARWDAVPRQLADDDWAIYEAGFRERNASMDPTRVERTLADRRQDWGGVEPLFLVAIGDRVGGVWLAPYDIARLGNAGLYVDRYEVISPDGVHMGSVSFPSAIRVLDVTESLLLGIERDEFDVQAVALYQLIRSGG